MNTESLDLTRLLNSLSFRSTPGSEPPAPGLRGRPAMETLEPRLLLSTQTVIGFEDLYPGSQADEIAIPAGYKGLNWNSDCQCITSEKDPGTGYETGTIGNVAMYTAWSHPVTFSVTSGTFDFAGCYITSAFETSESVTVQGFNGGDLVDNQVVTTGNTSAHWFDFNFANVDTVTITPGGTQLDIDNITVSGLAAPAPTVTAPSDQTAVEGASTTIGLGSFSQSGGASPWSVTVDWGDGSDNSTFSADSQGSLGSLAHTYAEEGTKLLTVSVADGSEQTGSAQFHVGVSDPAVVTTGGFSVTGVEGAATGLQTVATFTDPGGAESLASYSASIDWGDTTTSAGTITYSSGVFTVKGNHTYAEESAAGTPYVITVTASHDLATDATATSSATISDPTVVATGGFSVTGTEGSATSLQTVATFTDPGGAEPLADYWTNIHWGDGGNSPGTLTYDSDTGVFTLQGSHTFIEESATGTPYTVTVTIANDVDLESDFLYATATSHATVSDPAAVVTGGFTVTGSEGAATGLQTVATFTDPGGSEPLRDYSATINWGDGTSSTAGTISGLVAAGEAGGDVSREIGPPVYAVKGSHTYADNGTFVVAVTVSHDLAEDAVGTSAATIGNVAPVITALSTTSPSGQQAPSQTVTLAAAFGDVGDLDTHTATVDWGDGATAAGVVTETGGSGTVAGTHAYLTAGVYTVTLTVRDNGSLTDSDTAVAMIRGAAIHGGVLEIVGTDAADKITVTTKGNTTTVLAGFLPLGWQSFSRTAYQSIHIWALGGNDSVDVCLVVSAPATVEGGDGDDTLRAGGGATTLLGASGNDTLWGGSAACILLGGAGNDVLRGGCGPCVLVGGAGANTLVGGAGRDILIGGSGPSTVTAGGRDSILIAGTTLYDDDTTALAALSAEWNSGPAWNTAAAWNLKVSHLTTGGGLNGTDTLAGAHVIGNALVDMLKGNAGHNWFFRASGSDLLSQVKHTDLVTDLT